MPLATLFHDSLLATLDAAFEAVPPGIIVAGMPASSPDWLPRLVAALRADDQCYVSVAGADEAMRATLPAPVADDLRFGLGATHAVAVRNAKELPATARRVVVMLRPEARLHSLRQRNYVPIGPADVVRHLARQQAALPLPLPQQQLWQSLANGRPPVGLLAFLDFYQAVTGPGTPPSPRDELHRLEWLPDPSLFDHPQRGGIAQRLAENAELTQKLLLGDPDDERKAHQQCLAADGIDAELASRLRGAYVAFRALDPAAPLPAQLQALSVPLVRQLFGGALPAAGPARPLPGNPLPTDPNPEPGGDDQAGEGEAPPYGEDFGGDGNYEPDDESGPEPGPAGGRSGDTGSARLGSGPRKKYTAGLDDAVVRLAAGEVASLAGHWTNTAEKLLKQLKTRLAKDPDETKPLEAAPVQVVHRTPAVALALTNALLGEALLGGVLALPQTDTAEAALAALVADQLPPAAPAWDAAWLDELRRYLRTADGLVPALAGETALADYLAARTALLPYRLLLTSAPLSAVLLDEELRDIAGRAVAAYNQLFSTVARHYAELQQHNRAGERIAGLLLRLDVVEVRAGTSHRAALLTPLHPLGLWKYLELARPVLAGPEQARELLDVLDRPGAVPEPLRALVLPADGSFPTVPLAQADRLGAAWPLYRPTGLVRVTVEESLLVEAARKLAVLYPPVRACLRLFVYHPEQLESVAEALEQLGDKGRNQVKFDRFQVLIGYLPGQPVSLLPLDGLLNEGVLTVETRPVEHTDEVSTWLQHQPVHLLVLAGQRHLHPLSIGREATHLHPLSLPQVLEFDHFDPRNALVLRPRGQQADAHGKALSRPFDAFHTLAAEVAGQPGREYSGSLSKPAPDGTQPALLPLTVLLLLSAEVPTAADPDHVLVLARQGGLSGDTVLTRWNKRYVAGLRAAVLNEFNYEVTDSGATKLLRRLEATGHTNLLRAISASSSAKNGFLPTELSGQLGQAVALRWYEDQATDRFYLTVSCDSALARRWLAQRDTGLRPDLLGLRRRPEDGELSLDIIEVKSHKIEGDLEAPGQPGPQLRAAARALLPILTQAGGDLLTDCRRELLRAQLFHEGQLTLPPDVAPAEWAAWVKQLSIALDGQTPPTIGLMLIEVIKDENFSERETSSPGDPNGVTPAERAPIRRVQLGEQRIQNYLKDKPSGPGGQGRLAPPNDPNPTPSPLPDNLPSGQQFPAGTSVEPANSTAADAKGGNAPTPTTSSQSLSATPTPLIMPRPAALAKMAGDLYATLQDFGITPARPINPALADVGPSLIRFKVELARGQRGSAVQNLAADIQRGMELHYLPRIENLAGTGFLAVEVPRLDPQPVALLPVLAQEASQPTHPLGSFPAGLSPDGVVRWLTVSQLPHMLVGGTTNSGKSMFLNSLIVSLTKLQPASQLRLVLIDPKGAEFSFFKRLPHLLTPIIRDAEPAIETLTGLMDGEYVRRRDVLEKHECLNIQDYYRVQPPETMPLIVIVIDELETFLDSMSKANRATFENLLGSIARLTRYVGIHLVAATQRPDSKVIYGNLKNNLDCRVAFRLASNTDSRVILKEGGAEDLMGAGDMLLQVGGRMQRLQGFYLPTEELRTL